MQPLKLFGYTLSFKNLGSNSTLVPHYCVPILEPHIFVPIRYTTQGWNISKLIFTLFAIWFTVGLFMFDMSILKINLLICWQSLSPSNAQSIWDAKLPLLMAAQFWGGVLRQLMAKRIHRTPSQKSCVY